MRIKLLTAAVATAALLGGAGTAYAGDIEEYNGGWANIADNTAINANSTGSVTMSSGSFGSVTCGDMDIDMNIDQDGSVDAGDVTDTDFTSCTASFFGWPSGSATVTPCNLSSASGLINGTSMTVSNTCNDISAACGSIRVEGNLSGSFTNPTNTPPTNGSTAQLSGAAGLSVTSESGFCASVGNAATFSGTFAVRTVTGSRYLRSL